MSLPHSLEFIVPPRVASAEQPAEWEEALHLRAVGRDFPALAYYDSFDWRLHRAGFEYAVENVGGQLAAVSGGTEGSRNEPVRLAGAPPRFAHELPEGKWSRRLAEALGVRALLPRVELRGMRRVSVLEDGEGVAVLHLALESFSVDRNGTPLALPARLRLIPVKGCRREFRHVRERLTGEFGLEPAGTTLLSDALAALGRVPEDPSALRIRLDPELRADAAVKQVLRSLLETLRINEAGVKAETDTEFLHDFRVAVRRTRSALGRIGKVFPDRVVLRFARGFAELGRITGEPRDLDVYLLDFDRHGSVLPEPLRGGLDPLRELLQRRAREAHVRLNRYLESAAYRRLLGNWTLFLDTPPPCRPRAPEALVPIRAVAGRKIWKLYRRVLEEGWAITSGSPPEQLHELRKTAKKLRYLLELFRSLYPPDRVAPPVKILKTLQDHLGEYQDIQVQIARLREFAGELRQAGAPTETLLALGALIDRLYGREKILREGFGDCFAGFSEAAHQRKFKSLFKPEAVPGDGS